MSKRKLGPPPIVYLVVFLLLGGLGYFFLTHRIETPQNSTVTEQEQPKPQTLTQQMSTGDHLLITADATAEKQAGVKAMASGDTTTAIARFEASLQSNPNDPETLIYWNNAKVAGGSSLKIAVSVPIGSNLNVAQEILRGVAQAQQEINDKGGVNGTPLTVVIANDNNDPEFVTQVASKLVDDPSILAVVGHNSSNVSLAAAPIYQAGQLVMISPTSDAKTLSGVGSYIFRTIPSVRFQANSLSRYLIQTARVTTVAICADEQAAYSVSFKEELTATILADGGRVANTDCNLSASDFNANTVIADAVSAGADGLILAPSVDRLKQAIEVARANQNKLSLFGSATLYTFQTLQQGQGDVNGMILAVSWHPKTFPNNPFAQNAERLWRGPVNWRTAMAYDATLTIISGLQQNPTRQALQANLSRRNFSVEGATGTIEFLPSGDRNATSTLVKIQPGNLSGAGYDFVPVSP